MKILKLVSLFMLVVVIFTACEFGDDDVQYNMSDTYIYDKTNIIMIDTITVKSYSTVPADSFVTNGTKRLLAGSFTNDYGIKTNCECYFRLDQDDVPDFDDNESTKFDSVCLVMFLDGYYYGDTTKTGEFEVYRVIEEIEEDVEEDALFNTMRFKTEEEPLGRFTINLENKDQRDSIFVRLDDDFGQRIFDLTYDISDSIFDSKIFDEEFFNGFAIRPAEGSSAIVVGIDTDTDSSEVVNKLEIYYHDNTPNDKDRFYYFTLDDDNSLAYNYIMNDYSESVFAGTELLEGNKPEYNKVSSNDCGNVSFVQTGLMYSRFEIPPINELNDALGVGAILQAELLFYPYQGTFEEEWQLPTGLGMKLVDDKNRKYAILTDATGSTESKSTLYYDDIFEDESYYSIDVTSYVQTELQNDGDHDYNLLMYSEFSNTTPDVDQLILGNTMLEKDHGKLILKIYMSNYDIVTE